MDQESREGNPPPLNPEAAKDLNEALTSARADNLLNTKAQADIEQAAGNAGLEAPTAKEVEERRKALETAKKAVDLLGNPDLASILDDLDNRGLNGLTKLLLRKALEGLDGRTPEKPYGFANSDNLKLKLRDANITNWPLQGITEKGAVEKSTNTPENLQPPALPKVNVPAEKPFGPQTMPNLNTVQNLQPNLNLEQPVKLNDFKVDLSVPKVVQPLPNPTVPNALPPTSPGK